MVTCHTSIIVSNDLFLFFECFTHCISLLLLSGGNHNLALSNKNEIYSWGYGEMLALGHGVEKDEYAPKKVNFDKAKIPNLQVSQVDIYKIVFLA